MKCKYVNIVTITSAEVGTGSPISDNGFLYEICLTSVRSTFSLIISPGFWNGLSEEAQRIWSYRKQFYTCTPGNSFEYVAYLMGQDWGWPILGFEAEATYFFWIRNKDLDFSQTYICYVVALRWVFLCYGWALLIQNS